MKRIVSLLLSFIITLNLLSAFYLPIYLSAEATTDLIDKDILRAKCLAGVVNLSNTDSDERCRKLYNYYIDEEVYSPVQSFLKDAYANHQLMLNYNEWMAISLAAEPSSALNLVVSKEKYYEACIIAMYSGATSQNEEFKEMFKNRVLNSTNAIIKTMCELKGVYDTAEVIELYNINDPNVITAIQKSIKDTYLSATAAEMCGEIGNMLTYGSDIIDVVERLAVYGEMIELDKSTKLWLSQIYEACDADYDLSFKNALYNLKTASTDYAGAALVDIKTTGFTLANWGIGAAMDKGMEMLAGINPVTAAVCAGLKLGKTVSDLFFATDDICEQLYIMNCIFDIQGLSRTVAKKSEKIFIEEQTRENATIFTYAVDCYFESIISIDIDCMKKLLDVLYNGGSNLLKGTIRWAYGTVYSYQDAVTVLESLREVRQKNYDLMNRHYMVVLSVVAPSTFDFYFEPEVPITGISFKVNRILPSQYPNGYADMIVGDYAGIQVEYSPSNTTKKVYNMTSDNPGVVKVINNALLAVSVGTAKVTITSLEKPSLSFTSTIKVGKKLDVFYSIESNNEVTITGLSESFQGNLKIPSEIQGYPVTKIANNAFGECENLTSVTIPDSVKSLGYCAFYYCKALTSVNLGNGITSIEAGTFHWCEGLTSIVLPNSVTAIETEAFSDCINLESVVIPPKTKTIGYYAFYRCKKLKSLFLPDSVTTIDPFAFAECYGLKSIKLPKNLTAIDTGVFENCKNLTSLTIPNSVNTIGDYSFSGCTELASVTIPNNVTTIGNSAFYRCTSITNVWYSGDQTNKEEMIVEDCNNSLQDTIWHYECTPGDVNDNGEITIADVVLLLRVITGGISKDLINEKNADVLGESGIDTADVILILRQLVNE